MSPTRRCTRFRGGPCPTPDSSSGLGGTSLDCENTLDGTPRESGGEELWAFVPFDQLAKLPALTKIQSRENRQYLLAVARPLLRHLRAGRRHLPRHVVHRCVADHAVLRPRSGRQVLHRARRHGARTLHPPSPSKTEAPIVVWNRGNPDTNNGRLTGAGGVVNYICERLFDLPENGRDLVGARRSAT